MGKGQGDLHWWRDIMIMMIGRPKEQTNLFVFCFLFFGELIILRGLGFGGGCRFGCCFDSFFGNCFFGFSCFDFFGGRLCFLFSCLFLFFCFLAGL